MTMAFVLASASRWAAGFSAVAFTLGRAALGAEQTGNGL